MSIVEMQVSIPDEWTIDQAKIAIDELDKHIKASYRGKDMYVKDAVLLNNDGDPLMVIIPTRQRK